MVRLFLCILVAGVSLISCGGGASGPDLSKNQSDTGQVPVQGIFAADGSPMAYGAVTISSLVNSSTSSATADVNGNTPIPASGITYPALVKVISVSGNKVNYGYIADSAQTVVPVNPLSTLVIAIASGGNPAAVTSTSQLSASALGSAKTSVNTIFSGIFSAFSVSPTIDLLRTNFSTNHTGLDLILDAMNIKFGVTGNPTICTKLQNTCKTLDLAQLDTTPLTISASEVTQLNSVPIATCSGVINGLTSTSITSDASLYASDFLQSGLSGAQYRTSLASKFGTNSATFHSPIFIGTDFSNNFVFQFDYLNAATHEYVGSMSLPFKLEANRCVMAGDQLPFWIQVTSQITAQTRVDGTNSPAVTTASPVRGLDFRAGGDGLGGQTVQNTLIPAGGGSPVTIATLQFYLCNANDNCSQHLMDMVKGSTNNGYYYIVNGENTIPVVSYTSAGINSAGTFYNGNPKPILVKMLDANGTVQRTVRLRVRGGFITAAEMSAIAMPSITNAQTILSTQSTIINPSLAMSIPTGTVVQSLSLSSGLMIGQVTTTSKFVMSSQSGSTTIPRTLDAATDYRSIFMGASTTGGIPMSLKYVWSPTCTGCS